MPHTPWGGNRVDEERRKKPPLAPEMRDTGLLERAPRQMWATVRLDELEDDEFARTVEELCCKVTPIAIALPADAVMAGAYDVQAHLLVDGSQVPTKERAREFGLSSFTVPGGTWAEIELWPDDEVAAVYGRLTEDMRLMGCSPGEFFFEELPCRGAPGHIAVEFRRA